MRTAIWIVLLTIVATYGIYAYATLDRTSDEAQIRNIIQNAAVSVEKRNLSGCVTCISQDYKDDSGLNYDRLRLFIAQALRRNDSGFSVKAPIRWVRIKGDKADINLRVSISLPKVDELLYERNLIIHVAREDGRHALFVPVKVWRIVGTENMALPEMQGF